MQYYQFDLHLAENELATYASMASIPSNWGSMEIRQKWLDNMADVAWDYMEKAYRDAGVRDVPHPKSTKAKHIIFVAPVTGDLQMFTARLIAATRFTATVHASPTSNPFSIDEYRMLRS